MLTPVWLVVEWQDNGAFKHWSNNGNPGDWEPWILYVALIWGLIVGIKALQSYFDRPTTEAEVDAGGSARVASSDRRGSAGRRFRLRLGWTKGTPVRAPGSNRKRPWKSAERHSRRQCRQRRGRLSRE